ncbi:MAG: hypothetical protein LR008_02070 [Candidatus Pacebacteria bacterium]|nr:hypothetical protein [Candidatus Paceibacterota bacterium]
MPDQKEAKIDKLNNRRHVLLAQVKEINSRINRAYTSYDDLKLKKLKIRRVSMKDELALIVGQLEDVGVDLKPEPVPNEVARFRSKDRSMRHVEEQSEFVLSHQTLATA